MCDTGGMHIPGLPSLPTDNFYKFRALAGIWLVSGTIAGIGIGVFQFVHEIYETKLRLAVLEVDSKALDVSIDAERVRVFAHEKEKQKVERVAASLEQMLSSIERYVQEIEGIRVSRRPTAAQIDEARRMVAIARGEHDQLARRANDGLNRLSDSLKSLENHRQKNVAMRRDLAQVGVLADKISVLGTGLILMTLCGTAMVWWGIQLARTGFREWRELQSLQDELLRRQVHGMDARAVANESSENRVS